MLASRQKTHSKKVRPASKIVLLPSISRALVLSIATASIFSLPEFAPMSGIGSLRDVNDLSRDIDERLTDGDQEEAVVTAFTKTAIRIVKVQKNSLKLLRNVEYPNVLLGLRRSGFALVANTTDYSLIDLENSQQIPLFPISTAGEEQEAAPAETTEDENKSPSPPPEADKTSKKIKPVIVPVGADEFLVLSGSKTDEPAMGLVVNLDGDISRGTIAWPQYPESVAVDYPYVASVIGTQVQFHSLHDQSLVQTIEFESTPIVSNVSAVISQPYHPLADKIRLVPLVDGENSERMETERKNAEKLSVISSSLFVYSKERGVQCLMSSPRIFHLEKLVQQEKLDEVLEEMGTLEITTERAVVELEYLNLLVGMGYILHKDFNSATGTWQTGSLDPRLIVYIYDPTSVVGDVWLFNGIRSILKTIVAKYSEEIAIDKSTGAVMTSTKKKDLKKAKHITAKDQLESRQFYQYFLKDWLAKRDMESLTDKKHIFHTIEKASLQLLLKLDAEGAIKKKEVYSFIQKDVIDSLEDTITILEAAGRYYGLFLLYKQQGESNKVCDLWKKIFTGEIVDGDFKGTEEEFAEYLQQCEGPTVWDYGMWMANRNPEVGLKIFTKRSEFNDAELMEAFKKLDNPQVWRDFLRILVYDKKDYSFHADLVIVCVEDLQQEIHKSAKNQAFVMEGYKKYRELALPKRAYYDYMGSSGTSKELKKIMKMRQDLVGLLAQNDRKYDHDLVRMKLEGDKDLLQLELCVVYNQMNLHSRCIDILCNALQDFDQAISYCQHAKLVFGTKQQQAQEPKADEDTQNELFPLLYDASLKMEPESVQIQCTRHLLESHGSRLDLSTVMAKTPAEWPLERLSGYLLNVLRNTTKEKNRSTLQRSLARAENTEVRDMVVP